MRQKGSSSNFCLKQLRWKYERGKLRWNQNYSMWKRVLPIHSRFLALFQTVKGEIRCCYRGNYWRSKDSIFFPTLRQRTYSRNPPAAAQGNLSTPIAPGIQQTSFSD